VSPAHAVRHHVPELGSERSGGVPFEPVFQFGYWDEAKSATAHDAQFGEDRSEEE